MIVPDTAPGVADVVRHYGELDPFYRELWGEHVHHGLWWRGDESPEEAVGALVRHVADLAEVTPGEEVVDIGSGYGATARWLSRERGVRVTAITLSPTQHERALRAPLPEPGPRYVLGDWLENDLEASAFDAAVAIESTEHMGSLDLALAEVARVLRPGGRLVLCAWLAAERVRPWESRHLLRPLCVEGRLARLVTMTELRALLETHGLRVDRADDLSARVCRTWTICLGRAVRRLVSDPGARRFLLDPARKERMFAPALVRIRLAYATGSLRYGVFRAWKASDGESA